MAGYVIIGNGIAAVGCIEGIRSIDKETPITVVSEEKHPVYGRPLISYMLLGKTNLERMNYRAADFYEKNGCTVLYGVKAESIDATAKTIKLSDGAQLEYKALCIATGSKPFVPPFEGIETVESKFGFMNLDDALALEKVLDADKKVLVIGAGLIGLKCVEGIADRVKEVVVADLSDRILPSYLDTECAAMLQAKLEEKGVEFMLCDTVTKCDKNTAVTKSGATLDFDILVLAVGVKPNTDLAKAAGATVNKGIVVDANVKTSLDCVYAAGDCSEGFDSTIGAQGVVATLPNASAQGLTAGINMAGGNAENCNAIPVNSMGFFELHAMTAGRYEGEVLEEKTEGMIKKFFVKDGLLKGFMIVGDTAKAGIYTALIREKTALETVNFDLLMEAPTLAAYSREKRNEMLGGAK
ncbi:MAG: FAD-dependent oxidoreductase [Clostridia bacterium]|nr:FAD-dependent oxidoreductase [Clostridia bacterium]